MLRITQDEYTLYCDEHVKKSQDIPPFVREMGERIKAARRKMGLTQEQAAVKADIPKRTYETYERAEIASPSQPKVQAIASALGKTPSDLLPGQGDGGRQGIALQEAPEEHEEPEYVEARGIVVCAGDGAEPEQYKKHIVPAAQYARDHATSVPLSGQGDRWYAQVTGDSMAPEFFENDWLPIELVQKPLTQLKHSGLYVVYWMDFLQFKRVAPSGDGGYRLMCTNPAFPDEKLTREQAKEAIVCARVKLRERDQLFGSLMRRVVGEN